MPPSTLGMPCKLCTPHVSWRPLLAANSITRQKPVVESSPAMTPMRTAPNGVIGRLATAPMDTPPASAAFCISTGLILDSDSSGESTNVETVEPVRASS
eukprot:6213991-Pleurochrysis_carterae.AAC.2